MGFCGPFHMCFFQWKIMKSEAFVSLYDSPSQLLSVNVAYF